MKRDNSAAIDAKREYGRGQATNGRDACRMAAANALHTLLIEQNEIQISQRRRRSRHRNYRSPVRSPSPTPSKKSRTDLGDRVAETESYRRRDYRPIPIELPSPTPAKKSDTRFGIDQSKYTAETASTSSDGISSEKPDVGKKKPLEGKTLSLEDGGSYRDELQAYIDQYMKGCKLFIIIVILHISKTFIFIT